MLKLSDYCTTETMQKRLKLAVVNKSAKSKTHAQAPFHALHQKELFQNIMNVINYPILSCLCLLAITCCLKHTHCCKVKIISWI